jgi:hypothetical protein
VERLELLARGPARLGRASLSCAPAGAGKTTLLPNGPAADPPSRTFRWSLAEGLRVIKPTTYMAIGEYPKPSGYWITSVLY